MVPPLSSVGHQGLAREFSDEAQVTSVDDQTHFAKVANLLERAINRPDLGSIQDSERNDDFFFGDAGRGRTCAERDLAILPWYHSWSPATVRTSAENGE